MRSDGIRRVSVALKQGGYYQNGKNCADTIREFDSIVMDTVVSDIPLKENDHAMDDIRICVILAEGDG